MSKRLLKHTKNRIIDGYNRQQKMLLGLATRCSITKRYGVRLFNDDGIILSQMTLKRSEYYQNVSAHASR